MPKAAKKSAKQTAAKPPKIKVLQYAGGEIHDWEGCGNAIYAAIQPMRELAITRACNDLSCLEAPKLDPYEVIVFYHTVGAITDAQKNGLLNWVASGKGYVGIHSAADSFRECPEYRAMVGGWFVTHPHYRAYQVSVVDPQHPITRDLTEFTVTDEQYVTDYDPRVNVLANGLYQGQAMPVVWTKGWGRGRVAWIALGHDAPACGHETFKLLLQRAVLWAAARD